MRASTTLIIYALVYLVAFPTVLAVPMRYIVISKSTNHRRKCSDAVTMKEPCTLRPTKSKLSAQDPMEVKAQAL
jgi:hypothetical protein